MSKSLEAVLAIKALVARALPGAALVGFDKDATTPTRIGPQGCIIGHFGEPGDPEMDLGPPTYNYSHRMYLEVVAANGAGGAAVDAMLAPIGAEVAADRTLGGICDYVSVGAPDFSDRSTDAIATSNWAVVPVDMDYSTSNPLA